MHKHPENVFTFRLLLMKRLICILLTALPLCALHAQHLQLTDTKFYCNGHEETFGDIYDVIQTKDGGFAFVGNTIDSGGGFLPYCTNLYRRGIMGKLDSNGNLLWINNMCNAGIFPETICETPDGGFAVNGGAPTTSPLGMLIFRYDKNGNLVWEKNYGRNAHAGTNQIITTPDGGFLLGGYAYGVDSDITVNYHLPPTTFQPVDWVVMKLDSLGNKQWVRTLGTSGDEGSARLLAYNGYYYLIGETRSSDHDCADVTNHPGYTIYAIKLDGIGNVLWSRAHGWGEISRVMYDERDNSILVTGRVHGAGQEFTGGYGDDDFFLMKLDTAANYKWGKLYGTANPDEAHGLCLNSNKGYILSGHSYDYKNYNGFLVSIDSNGKPIEQKMVTGGSGGLSYINVFRSNNGISALGICYSIKLNEGTGTNCTYGTIGSGALMLSRFQLWKAGVTTAPTSVALLIAPNPAHNSFRISLDKAHSAGTVTGTNNLGQTIYRQKVAAGVPAVEISAANWPRSNYIISWQPENGPAVFKTLTIN